MYTNFLRVHTDPVIKVPLFPMHVIFPKSHKTLKLSPNPDLSGSKTHALSTNSTPWRNYITTETTEIDW